jgi:hypothetical protein
MRPFSRGAVRVSAAVLCCAFCSGLIAAEAGSAAGAADGADLPAGMQRLANGDIQFGELTLHRSAGEISFPATMVLGSGVLEVVIATPSGRLHESLLSADVSPLQFQAMLYLLGLGNGPRLPDPVTGRQGDLVDIEVAWTGDDGTVTREPVEQWIHDTRVNGPMKRLGWVFVGSTMRDGAFLAEVEGNICVCYSVGSTILDSPDPESIDDTLFVVNEKQKSPGVGAQVRVYIVPRKSREK